MSDNKEEKKEEKEPEKEPQLTVEQTKAMKAAFASYDIDKNGKISKEEIKEVVKKNSGEELSAEDLDAMMLNITGSADNELEWKDFLKLMTAYMTSDEELKKSFDRFDLNSDGVITEDEL